MKRTLLQRAEDFATCAHVAKGQVRKYTNEPYWMHCKEVAFLVEAVGGDEEMIAAAWLHDTVEDTDTTFQNIHDSFGARVTMLVSDVTDISRPEDGNRATRKAIDREHIALASPEGKTIKLADLISNASTINRHDPNFAVVYMREKRELLPFLAEGNPILLRMAEDIVKRYYLTKDLKESHGKDQEAHPL